MGSLEEPLADAPDDDAAVDAWDSWLEFVVFDDEVGVFSPLDFGRWWLSGEWTLPGVVLRSTEARPCNGDDLHSEGVFLLELLLPNEGTSSFLDVLLELVREEAEWTLVAGLQDKTSLSFVTRISSLLLLLLLLLLLPELPFFSDEDFEEGFSAPILLHIWTSRAKGLVLQSDWKERKEKLKSTY